MTETEARVLDALRAVFANKGRPAPALEPGTVLDRSLGLESLDFAELVARLELAFGTDPFSAGNLPPIRTVADLAALYAGGPVSERPLTCSTGS
jgi:acyl carrier protein